MMIILFDGVCNLCNAWVQFVLKRDKCDRFLFASLQSQYGEGFKNHSASSTPLPDSIILYDGRNVFTKSTAVLKIATGLGGAWKLFSILLLLPKPVRDFLYDLVARNRYKIFGRKDTCMIPEKPVEDKFLDNREFPGNNFLNYTAATMEQEHFSNERWSTTSKIFFRFLFAYIVLYIFPFPLNFIPYSGVVTRYYVDGWNTLVPWAGNIIFNVAITVQPNGSGDTTYNYVQVFLMFMLALCTSVVWSALDRKRNNYQTLLSYLKVGVRYYLAVMMLSYGFAKVFKSQFPFSSLTRLITPFGQSSPMGIAWKFMGYSTAYTFFAGAMEVLGGALLFFRRTVTLGALLLIGVIGNIVMMNFAYDIPVKLFSLHLFLLTVFLAACDSKRVINFFFRNKPVPPAVHAPLLESPRAMLVSNIFKTVVIGYLFYANISQGIEGEKKWGDAAPKPPLFGIYDVDTFMYNGATLGSSSWKKIIIDKRERFSTQAMNDVIDNYACSIDTGVHRLSFSNATRAYDMTYFITPENYLELNGKGGNDSLFIRSKRIDESTFLLLNRGFHWINEYPYNR